MTAGSPVAAAFERRAQRADLLAPQAQTAGAVLVFAAGLYRAQARLAATLEARHARQPLTGRLDEDVTLLVETSQELLHFVAENGPPGLAHAARDRSTDEAGSTVGTDLARFWDGRAATPDYLSRALLRPYVEVLASLRIRPDRAPRQRHCPFCGGAPWIAARRAVAEADGEARFLGCSLCGGEWPLARVRCASCEEEHPERLPSFRSDPYPAVRIEACETCRRYVKSIDLTVDGNGIPEVDDLASLGMDLWAASQGFARIEAGLAGI